MIFVINLLHKINTPFHCIFYPLALLNLGQNRQSDLCIAVCIRELCIYR